MYLTVLTLHSWNRWLALILGFVATVNAFSQTPAVRDGRPRGSKWDTLFMAAVDLQVLFGLLLYFGLSPYSTEALGNLSEAMASPRLRFWAVEHEVLAFASVISVRIGRVLTVTGKTPEARQRRRLICFTLALALMVLAAFLERRPWFRAWPA